MNDLLDPVATETSSGDEPAGSGPRGGRRPRPFDGPRSTRSIAVGIGITAAMVLYMQLVLPGNGAGRGTPGAVLFGGLVTGMLNSLTAAGIILVYRSTRIVNFSQTALGAAGGQLTFQLLELTEVPFALAFVLGVAAAGVFGLGFDIVIGRRFFKAPRLVLTVATIAAAGLLASFGSLVALLPFFPRNRTIAQELGAIDIRGRFPFAGFEFQVGRLEIGFGFPELFALEVSVLALVGVALFFRMTRAGIAVRGMAENTERAPLLGMNLGSLSSVVWALAGVLSGAAVILTGGITGPGAAAGIAPQLLLPALAAAVIARMESIPVATAASVAIATLTAATTWSFRTHAAMVDVALFVLIGVVLLARRRAATRSEEPKGISWLASAEQRPIPKELLEVTGVRVARNVLLVLALALALVFPFIASTGTVVLGAVIAVNAMVAVSIVVLTGWAGQVSLGQFGFVAIGAVVAGALTGRAGLTFWLAVPMASAVTAGCAVLVGIPALRIRGLFLAVTTFAFSIAVASVLFERRYFGWLLADALTRPTFFFFDFDDERSMYFLCLGALLLTLFVVANLRRSWVGRVLIAARENEPGLQSLGIKLIRAKLLGFAVAGAIAGFAGAVFAHQQRGLNAASFGADRSIDLFLATVLGGVGSTSGALLGATYLSATTYFFGANIILASLQPMAVLGLLYISPGGLIAVLTALRDSALRVVAQRRRLVVPSLFADFDPNAIANHVAPLASPSATSGLGALPATARFDLPSVLYPAHTNGGDTSPPAPASVGLGSDDLESTPVPAWRDA